MSLVSLLSISGAFLNDTHPKKEIVSRQHDNFSDTSTQENIFISTHNIDGSMGGYIDTSFDISSERKDNQRNINNLQKHTILSSGKPDNESIVAVFLGDGFTQNEQNYFLSKVEEIADFMVEFEPFVYYKDYITIYAIECVSNESGISGEVNGEFACLNNNQNPTTLACTPYDDIFNCIHGKDTYFHTHYKYDMQAERVLLNMNINDRNLARNIAQQFCPSVNMIQVISNSAMSGGISEISTQNSQAVALSSINYGGNTNWIKTVMHEFGHSFGGLGDEYWNKFDQIKYPNVTNDNDPNTITWKKWLGCLEVGIYPFDSNEGDGNPNQINDPWFRPHQGCLMRSTANEFCPVCQENMLAKMASVTGINLFDTTNLGTNQIRIDNFNAFHSGEFSIPEAIDGRIVTNLGAQAFANHTEITSISIPSTVTNIGNQCFYNCTNLETVSINTERAPLISLGTAAFNGCNEAIQITVPPNRIGDYKNLSTWSSYNSKIIPRFTGYETYFVRNGEEYNISINCNISSGYNKFVKLRAMCSTNCLITAFAANNIVYRLYDSSFSQLRYSINPLSVFLQNRNDYYLSLEFSDFDESGIFTTNIEAGTNHYHSYGNQYLWKNLTLHKTFCSCGHFLTEAHVVSSRMIGPGTQIATCLLCGGQASIGMINQKSNRFITENGSYIFPNGIIVISELDLEKIDNFHFIDTLPFFY